MNIDKYARINEDFLHYCEKGDMVALETHCKNHPEADIHHNNNIVFINTCSIGQIESIKHLLNRPGYLGQIKLRKQLFSGFRMALNNQHIDLAKILFSHYEQPINSTEFDTQLDFFNACNEGKLDIVQYLLTDKNLNINSKELQSAKINAPAPKFYGFIAACEEGHLDIIKYLLTSPELSYYTEINLIEDSFDVKSIKVMKYFIFDLDLPKDHNLIQKINFYNQKLIDELFEKRELHKNLESNLLPSLERKNIRINKI